MKAIKILKGIMAAGLCAALMVEAPLTVCAEETAAESTTEEEAVQEESQTEVTGDMYRLVYTHDPRINAKAMADIVVDPDAVYGFKPDPKSTRLGDYADMIDWSDPDAVEAARQERIAYLAQFDTMYAKLKEMKTAGKDTETIARTLSDMRNQIRLDSYKNDPEGLEIVKKSNLATYGNENGPTADSLFEKYGSWDTVLLKCFSSNSGMDACLGLYEVQYANNEESGTISESDQIVFTVRKGDTLSKIADKYYGNPDAWTNIYNANKSVIKDKNKITVGQQLVIPVE